MRISDLQSYNVVQTAPVQATGLSTVPEERGAAFKASSTDSPLEAGLKSAGNVPGSAASLFKNIFSAVTHPVDTAKGVFNVTVGGGAKLRDAAASGIDRVTGSDIGSVALGAGKQSNASQEAFSALTESLKTRYGSLEAAQKTATEDPVGFGADLVAILSGSGAARAAGEVAVATGTAEKVSQASSALRDVVTNKLDNAAVRQMEKAIFINPSDVRKISKPSIAGTNPAEWLLRRGFQGSKEAIIDQLEEYGAGTKSAVDEGLSGIAARVTKEDAQPAVDTLEVLKKTFEDTIGNDEITAKIDAYLAQSDYSLSDLNAIKRLADSELGIFKSTGDIKSGATARGLFNVRDQLKTLIEDEAALNDFEDVKKLNKETQVSYEIAEALDKRLKTEGRLTELGLRDAIVGIGSFAATADIFTSLGLVVGKKILESTQFRTFLANKLKKAPPAEHDALREAITTRNYTKVLQYLAPVVNEFEKSQAQE